MQYLYVFLFGGIGCILRFILSGIPVLNKYPLTTNLINFIGCLLIGIIAFKLSTIISNRNIVIGLQTGLCGGFTTFSTFTLETFGLIQQGFVTTAVIYNVVSIFSCLIGVYIAYLIC